MQLCGKVTDLLSRLGEAPETFTGRILFMSMFNDISCDGKGNEEECVANSKVVSILAKKFGIGQWSFIGSRTRCCWNSQKADVLIFRATIFKSKGHGKLSIHFNADYPTIETFFRIIVLPVSSVFTEQLQTCLKNLETHQDRSGQPNVLMGQSIVLSEIQAGVPLENDIPSLQNILLQRYEERIKLLSQANKVSKFCMDAGFIHVVEIGQYFMTKDTEEQFFASLS